MRRRPIGYVPPIGLEGKVKYPVQDVLVESTNELEYVVIGKVINTVPEYPAKLFKSSIFRHILIAGTTGSGKSYTASVMAKRVVEQLGISTVILDWHGEYAALIPRCTVVDPYKMPLRVFTGDPGDLAVVSNVFELTPPQEYVLEKVLKKVDLSRLKTIDVFLDYLENYPDESTWIRESKLALHRKLSLLARENYGSLFKLHGPHQDMSSVLEGGVPCVVDLSGITDTSIRKLYSAFLLKRLVSHVTTTRRPVMIVIEEAQNYLSRNQAIKPICEMLREVRKFNVGLVVVSQSIQQLVEDAMTNANTKVIHSVKSRHDLELVERALYLDQQIISTLPYIDPGEAVYSSPSIKKPVLIRIE
ncbi:MAG: ATP-binding protein [Desulfurococcaceae archaeon]